jgi:calpain-7
VYTVIVSTFEPNLLATYFFTTSCSSRFSLLSIPPEGHGLQETVIKGEWVEGTSAVGCSHYQQYSKNPKYEMALSKQTRIKIRLQSPDIKPQPALNVSIYTSLSETSLDKEVASSGAYVDYVQGVCLDAELEPGRYQVVFSTWEPCPGRFIASLYT